MARRNLHYAYPIVEKFVRYFYKPERLDREEGLAESIIHSRVDDLLEHGEAVISRHESVTGKLEVLTFDAAVEYDRQMHFPPLD